MRAGAWVGLAAAVSLRTRLFRCARARRPHEPSGLLRVPPSLRLPLFLPVPFSSLKSTGNKICMWALMSPWLVHFTAGEFILLSFDPPSPSVIINTAHLALRNTSTWDNRDGAQRSTLSPTDLGAHVRRRLHPPYFLSYHSIFVTSIQLCQRLWSPSSQHSTLSTDMVPVIMQDPYKK